MTLLRNIFNNFWDSLSIWWDWGFEFNKVKHKNKILKSDKTVNKITEHENSKPIGKRSCKLKSALCKPFKSLWNKPLILIFLFFILLFLLRLWFFIINPLNWHIVSICGLIPLYFVSFLILKKTCCQEITL